MRPEPAVTLEPRVDLLHGPCVERVQTSGANGSNGREPAVAQDPKMERNRRLRDPELGLDHRAHLAGGPLTVGQQPKDAPANRIAEDVKGVHDGKDIGIDLYQSILTW